MNANAPAMMYDRRIPAPEDCITRLLIDRRARETPDKIFSLFPDGSSWTYRQLRDAVVQTALGHARLTPLRSTPNSPTPNGARWPDHVQL